MSADVIMLRDKKIKLEIPNFSKTEYTVYTVVWARHVKDNAYLMSLVDKDNCYTSWLVQVFPDGRFIPHSHTNSCSQEELLVLRYLKEQGIDGVEAYRKILESRLT